MRVLPTGCKMDNEPQVKHSLLYPGSAVCFTPPLALGKALHKVCFTRCFLSFYTPSQGAQIKRTLGKMDYTSLDVHFTSVPLYPL